MLLLLLAVLAAVVFAHPTLQREKNSTELNDGISSKNLMKFQENLNYVRKKRYIGLNKTFKINRRYQECIGPGDVQGHCKHLVFCPTPVLTSSKNAIDYLCVIEKMHVGVCCPDDIALSGLAGSQIITDLPGGGYDYDEADNMTGCGLSFAGAASAGGGSQWPWMAALYNPRKRQLGIEQQFCGGAVITELHVLSAAHCTIGLSVPDVRVRLGEYDFQRTNETRTFDYAVAEIVNHEEFEQASYANDVSILKMEKATSFNSYIWPICLPPKHHDFHGDMAVVAGWGQKAYSGPVSSVLLHVTVPIWPQEECVNAFLQRITDNNLCAASFDGGKDSCLGDSGGPLMYQLDNGRWVAVGIVSWGIGCGDRGSPGVYAKVGSFIPWIIKNTITKDSY